MIWMAVALGGAILGVQSDSTAAPAATQGTAPSYADLADLALPSPLAAHVQIRRAIRLEDERAAGVRPGMARYYVEAELVSLIRGAQGLPERVRYLVDVPQTGRQDALKRKEQYLLVGSAVPGRPGELQLAAPHAHYRYTSALADQLRALLREAAAPSAPPVISGVARAFHVPGSLPGESETQLFLQTADGRPVSLTVLRRPGQQPRWAVSLTEIVDEAAAPPAPGSLLWYRLACSLPQQLPEETLAGIEPRYRPAAVADYRVVIEGLGPCGRTR